MGELLKKVKTSVVRSHCPDEDALRSIFEFTPTVQREHLIEYLISDTANRIASDSKIFFQARQKEVFLEHQVWEDLLKLFFNTRQFFPKHLLRKILEVLNKLV